MNPGTKNNFYISLGVWLLIVPLLGIPNVWRDRLVELTGALLVAYATWPVIAKKISQKPRIKKEKHIAPSPESEKVEPIIPEIKPEEQNEVK